MTANGLCWSRDSSRSCSPEPVMVTTAGNFSPVFGKVRDCLVENARRADEAEHGLTSAEIRIRRLTADHDRLVEIADGLSDAAIAINHYDELFWANAAARELFAIDKDGEFPLPLAAK